MYMRRSGLSWETIIKISGHRSIVTLVKNYDLKLEAPGLAEVSRAIGTGPRVAMGETVDKVALKTKNRARGDRRKVVDIIDDANEIEDLTGNEEVAAKVLKTSSREIAVPTPHGSRMSTSTEEMAVPNMSANSTLVSASTRPHT